MRSTFVLALFLGGCFVNDVIETEASGAGGSGPGAGSAAGAAGPGGADPGGSGPGGAGAGGANTGGDGGGGGGGGPGPGGGGAGGGNPTCGDGIIQATDQCEDGNSTAGDQCDADCQFEQAQCTGSLDAGEACDSGAAPTANCADCQFAPASLCAMLPTYSEAGDYDGSSTNTTPFVSMGACGPLPDSAPTFGFNVDIGEWPRGVLIRTTSANVQTLVFGSAGCQTDLYCSANGTPSLPTDVFEPGSIRTFGISNPEADFRLDFTRHFARFADGAEGWTLGSGFTLSGGLTGISAGSPSESVSAPIYVGGLERIDILVHHTTSNAGAVDVKIRPQGGTWLDAIDDLNQQAPAVQGFATDIPPGTSSIEIGIEMKAAVTTVVYGVLVVEDDLIAP